MKDYEEMTREEFDAAMQSEMDEELDYEMSLTVDSVIAYAEKLE